MSKSVLSYCRLTDNAFSINGKDVPVTRTEGSSWLVDVYRQCALSYPKFHKMDRLSKAGYLAAEAVMQAAGLVSDPPEPKKDLAVVFMNRSASLDDDLAYQETIRPDQYFPSPAIFVYTLANIVTGEVAIRHKILGETSFYVAPRFNAASLFQRAEEAFSDDTVQRVLVGWVEYLNNTCDVLVALVDRQPNIGLLPWHEQLLTTLY